MRQKVNLRCSTNNTPLTRSTLLRRAGYEVCAAESGAEAVALLEQHAFDLRQKLGPDASAPRYILNVRGKGYLLSPVGE